MTTPFSDVQAAVEEGHFIQHKLNKTAYLVCDDYANFYVLTDEQYHQEEWSSHRVLEIFRPGGCDGDERIL